MLIAAFIIASPTRAQAADHTRSSTSAEPGAGKRALAAAIAIVPGALLHGAGHWFLGDEDAGIDLLVAEGGGAGLMIFGLVGLAVTGAANETVGPFATALITGAGLFTTSFLADLYGVLVPRSVRGSPRRLESLRTRVGLFHLSDPDLAYDGLLGVGLDLRFGRLRVSPQAYLATNDSHARVELEGAWRLFAQDVNRAAHSLDLVAAVIHHRHPSEGFAATMGEFRVDSRVHLAWLDQALEGEFVELSLGYQRRWTRFMAPGVTEAESQLLARFALGVYLDVITEGSEVSVYYQHRRDDYVAGLEIPGLGSGAAGHFGLQSTLYFSDRFGVRLDAAAGSASLLGASIVYREVPQ